MVALPYFSELALALDETKTRSQTALNPRDHFGWIDLVETETQKSTFRLDPSLRLNHREREREILLGSYIWRRLTFAVYSPMSLLNQLFNRGVFGTKWSVIALFFISKT